jgi:hypothetical protein
MEKTINQLAEENIADVLEHGPRLRTGQNTWIIARCPGKVLVGGLGCMGVGTMWFDEQPFHKDRPGYAEAMWQDEVPESVWG